MVLFWPILWIGLAPCVFAPNLPPLFVFDLLPVGEIPLVLLDRGTLSSPAYSRLTGLKFWPCQVFACEFSVTRVPSTWADEAPEQFRIQEPVVPHTQSQKKHVFRAFKDPRISVGDLVLPALGGGDGVVVWNFSIRLSPSVALEGISKPSQYDD